MNLEFDVQACITHYTIANIPIILCANCVKLTDFILCCSALTNGSSFTACLKDAVSFVDKYMVDVKELSSAEIYIFSYFFDRAKDADIIGNKKSPNILQELLTYQYPCFWYVFVYLLCDITAANSFFKPIIQNDQMLNFCTWKKKRTQTNMFNHIVLTLSLTYDSLFNRKKWRANDSERFQKSS